LTIYRLSTVISFIDPDDQIDKPVQFLRGVRRTNLAAVARNRGSVNWRQLIISSEHSDGNPWLLTFSEEMVSGGFSIYLLRVSPISRVASQTIQSPGSKDNHLVFFWSFEYTLW
jgi:hypothetical protein